MYVSVCVTLCPYSGSCEMIAGAGIADGDNLSK